MLDTITDNRHDNDATYRNMSKALERMGVTIPEQADIPDLIVVKPDLPTAVRNAVAAGKDPATDKTVREHLLRKTLYDSINVHELIELDKSKARLQHIKDHADTITGQAQENFTTALETIREQSKLINGSPEQFDPNGSTPANIARATVAPVLNRANAITEHWGPLLRFLTASGRTGGRHNFTYWCAPTWAQVEEHKLDGHALNNGRKFDVWEAVTRGIPLSLVTTPKEAERRKTTISEQQQEANDRVRKVYRGSQIL